MDRCGVLGLDGLGNNQRWLLQNIITHASTHPAVDSAKAGLLHNRRFAYDSLKVLGQRSKGRPGAQVQRKKRWKQVWVASFSPWNCSLQLSRPCGRSLFFAGGQQGVGSAHGSIYNLYIVNNLIRWIPTISGSKLFPHLRTPLLAGQKHQIASGQHSLRQNLQRAPPRCGGMQPRLSSARWWRKDFHLPFAKSSLFCFVKVSRTPAVKKALGDSSKNASTIAWAASRGSVQINQDFKVSWVMLRRF